MTKGISENDDNVRTSAYINLEEIKEDNEPNHQGFSELVSQSYDSLQRGKYGEDQFIQNIAIGLSRYNVDGNAPNYSAFGIELAKIYAAYSKNRGEHTDQSFIKVVVGKLDTCNIPVYQANRFLDYLKSECELKSITVSEIEKMIGTKLPNWELSSDGRFISRNDIEHGNRIANLEKAIENIKTNTDTEFANSLIAKILFVNEYGNLKIFEDENGNVLLSGYYQEVSYELDATISNHEIVFKTLDGKNTSHGRYVNDASTNSFTHTMISETPTSTGNEIIVEKKQWITTFGDGIDFDAEVKSEYTKQRCIGDATEIHEEHQIKTETFTGTTALTSSIDLNGITGETAVTYSVGNGLDLEQQYPITKEEYDEYHQNPDVIELFESKQSSTLQKSK